MSLAQDSLNLHKQLKGKMSTELKSPINDTHDLSLLYSPWVAEPCQEIAKHLEDVYEYTGKGNTIAVISDGSAVLGLGNIGPEAGLPVMEGKCALFKQFWNLNAVPIMLDTQDSQEIITTIKHLAPTFGGINLEDISAPRCFEIEETLKDQLDIPVFHDDQHGTAIVVLAGLINALKITGKNIEDIKIVINGVWAAGVAITKLLLHYGAKNILVVDSVGTIHRGRENLNPVKEMLTNVTNTACILDPQSPGCVIGGLDDAIIWADVCIGVSAPWVLTQEMVKNMNTDPIIFALANPDPEIMPEDAYAAGARIVATGRSDYPNQINNVLVFPGIFKGALENRVNQITDDMKISAAEALANMVENPTPEKIIPAPFDAWVADIVAKSVK